MIRVEATHNHPVMRTFCQILLDTMPNAQRYIEAPSSGEDPEIGDTEEQIGLKKYQKGHEKFKEKS